MQFNQRMHTPNNTVDRWTNYCIFLILKTIYYYWCYMFNIYVCAQSIDLFAQYEQSAWQTNENQSLTPVAFDSFYVYNNIKITTVCTQYPGQTLPGFQYWRCMLHTGVILFYISSVPSYPSQSYLISLGSGWENVVRLGFHLSTS